VPRQQKLVKLAITPSPILALVWAVAGTVLKTSARERGGPYLWKYHIYRHKTNWMKNGYC